MAKENIVRKIELNSLIDILIGMHDEGANYIDISIVENVKDPNQDIMRIGIREEYFEEEPINQPEIDRPLTDEDIKDILL